jgi:hypothetical protein
MSVSISRGTRWDRVTFWTPRRRRLLLALWRRGDDIPAICRVFGGCSANAITGMLYRLRRAGVAVDYRRPRRRSAAPSN